MGKIGCLLFLVVAGLLSVELWFALQLAEWVSPGNPEYLGSVLGVVVLTVIGIQLVRFRSRQFPVAMMAGAPGPAVVGIMGAALIALPGYLSGAVGVLLQLPVLQRAFGRFAAAMLTKRMQKMAGQMGGMPPGGFPGGMGGMPPGGFPGGFPGGMPPGGFPGAPGGLRPDAMTRKGKVIDTTAERVDEE